MPSDVGGYRIIRRLGAGGMGEVFLARQEVAGGPGRAVVVKTINSRLAGDREHESRFLDEARLTVQLRHRNICGVSNVGISDGAPFLVMDYVAGRDLRDVLHALAQRG
ncbi:MAG TPA: protein kinase, partial [Myxococcota bacterium]